MAAISVSSLTTSGVMAAEFIKNCCKGLLSKEKEAEPEAIKKRDAPSTSRKSLSDTESKQPPVGSVFGKKQVGCTEHFLLSRLPLDGKQVPFVVPTLKPSYIQPNSQLNSSYLEGLQGSARSMFTDRKGELSGMSQLGVDPDAVFHPSYMLHHVSPGSARRPSQQVKGLNKRGSVWDLKGNKSPVSPGLSSSMFDLATPHSHIQRYDSVSSVQSSESSMRDSLGSNRSLESITHSGDERELGKLHVRLCYQASHEQIWITVVRCKDLYLSGDHPDIGIKGTITLPKPVRFKSSVKEGTHDLEFMETFVFALKLQQLQTVGLVFKVLTHHPRKRTIGECAMSLRKLSSVESEHWLDITPISKALPCHAELNIGTCFQPVSSRIQLQILAAQNLPSSSTPLGPSFSVKMEMHDVNGLVAKKKTRALKSTNGQVKWGETFLFPIAQEEQGIRFTVRLYSRSSVRRKHFLGKVQMGWENSSSEAKEQWMDTTTNPEKVVVMWQKLNPI
ncbi:tandem C2 domains nuclear protein isoform X1 [Polyodon spathula]|uniref:tandem C2 domains nuclear protein isoform X1 n=1 Tax=Polyodon spathula TaxID=7913 RepID=UPI001B7E9210|nr:tandem C2 domains nuclear protein isoform X1 [Polyodon spathula]